jgi:uncharacterized protein (DUF2267 family)
MDHRVKEGVEKMEHEEFVEQVQLNVLQDHALRLSDAQTVGAIEAVLQTLAEQIDEEDRQELARTLPPALQDFWRDAGTSKSLTLDGFFQRIAERESIGVTVAGYYVSAVMATLGAALSTEAFERLQAELPDRFNPLFQRGAADELGSAL